MFWQHLPCSARSRLSASTHFIASEAGVPVTVSLETWQCAFWCSVSTEGGIQPSIAEINEITSEKLLFMSQKEKPW